MADLRGQVALVTGGTRGIGQAISTALGLAGASILVNYQSDDNAARRHVQDLANQGISLALVKGDASAVTTAKVAVQQALDQFGRLDILVNNVGITDDGLLMRLTDQQWDNVITTNLRSTFVFTREALRPMVRHRFGRVITIASTAGVVGNAGQSNYSASKAAQIGFTRALSREVASRGITVNAVAPGITDTAMTRVLSEAQQSSVLARVPLGRMGAPGEVADIVTFLASKEASYITGQVFGINGGLI